MHLKTRKLITSTLLPATDASRLVRRSLKLPAATAETITSKVPADVCVLMHATTTSVAATRVLVTVNSASAPAATVCDTVVITPDSALQVTPVHYLFKPDDQAMVDHFRRMADETGMPIIIYNVVPWSYLSPALLTRIMTEVPLVVGVKPSAGDLKLFADLMMMATPDELQADIYRDEPVLRAIVDGIHGCAIEQVRNEIEGFCDSAIEDVVADCREELHPSV